MAGKLNTLKCSFTWSSHASVCWFVVSLGFIARVVEINDEVVLGAKCIYY